jgi:hypothetical protein
MVNMPVTTIAERYTCRPIELKHDWTSIARYGPQLLTRYAKYAPCQGCQPADSRLEAVNSLTIP